MLSISIRSSQKLGEKRERGFEVTEFDRPASADQAKYQLSPWQMFLEHSTDCDDGRMKDLCQRVVRTRADHLTERGVEQ